MDTPVFENLDLACARAGKQIAGKPTKERENLITDALAVLEEQGIYALFLFLKSRKKEMSDEIINSIKEFMKSTPQNNYLLQNDGEILHLIAELSKDLDKLILARDILRQTLVYARYHVRLREGKG